MKHVGVGGRRTIELRDGWRVLQDVHDNGERLGIFEPGFAATTANGVSGWEEIPELGHLQLLLADDPYAGGRQLRSFNDHAWWYRLDFPVDPAGDGDRLRFARLRFEGVDYHATVWLNGHRLGEHEGYFEPFNFDVAELLTIGRPNVLVVRVASPWDARIVAGTEDQRAFGVERAMVKGTYEHMDGLVPRDVNPVGIWRPAVLELGVGEVWSHELQVTATLSDDLTTGEVAVEWDVESVRARDDLRWRVSLAPADRMRPAIVSEAPARLDPARNRLTGAARVSRPRLWQPWDRGAPDRYDVVVELVGERGEVLARDESRVGFRTVELERGPERTALLLNGRPYYLRGTSYFPDLYLSSMDEGRYRRDVGAAVAAGVNCLRVHVHVEQPAFYDVCDELGVLVVQDSDLNWVVPDTEEFVDRATAVVGAMVRSLREHPSIAAWVCVNEGGILVEEMREPTRRLAHHLAAVVAALDPTRPTIANSWDTEDPGSGDEHVYAGSLTGGAYADVRDARFRLLTEFGVDAPPPRARYGSDGPIAARLRREPDRVTDHHDYQYRLTKFYIERCRLERWRPNGGYIQFMWIDACPQSWYGVLDHWGCPKVDGAGGALRAFREVGRPVAVLLDVTADGLDVRVVNDLLRGLPGATLSWSVLCHDGRRETDAVTLDVPPDGMVRAARLPHHREHVAAVGLSLTASDSEPLADNHYDDIVDQPAPAGYPGVVEHELGVRLMP
ncbi:glycoside hydrolase family 2 protein [Pseudonocardia sp. MH-G8]|uniref:glycoside hydrolase family 2 protein n=1 Tax=Pseudonocardia sp. MH-G8 TaxID=1854588 RepID=UPI000BA0BD9A|nr:sugar-binding domain-containing protein [Pseudonocardia sp. MH-G8]OZM77900.1 hypothetical protein CFP66_33060 [Pseudonocardia sp. MH-G8]